MKSFVQTNVSKSAQFASKRFFSSTTNVRYANSHTWIKIEGTTVAVVGITNVIKDSFDKVNKVIDIPQIGQTISAQQVAAKIDGIKTKNTKVIEEIKVPLSGKIVELNQYLNTHPNLLLTESMESGSWLFKYTIDNLSEFNKMMDLPQYNKFLQDNKLLQ